MSRTDRTEAGVRITTLSNGVTVATEALPGVRTATTGVWVAAGSRHEQPDEHGLSHLLEHMAFKGTPRRNARRIAEDIENVGGEINAATSSEFTSYTARVLGEDVGLAIDVLGDILTNSLFDETELRREINVILQEYASIEDSPDEVVGDAFMEKAFSGQAIGRPILGRPQTIRRFEPAGIRAFIEREYTPARMVLAAAGAVDHAQVVEAAEAALGSLVARSAPETAPATYTGGEARLKRRLEQANVVIGLPGISFRDPGYFAMHMFAQALGGGLTSRLWQEVRETRGLAYEIDAFHWPYSDCGVFGIGAGTADRDLPELIEVATATARETAEGLEPEELARGRASLKVSLLAALETPGGRIERAARQLLAWGRIIPAEETVAHIDAVTVEEVRAAGRRTLAGPLTLAAIGPIRSLPPLERIAAALAA
ncbi:M16 family metallopeptidase [Enterovirga rhinocerotis]|uniref:Putative Zn-dependent peptidase n=1 Tax=Enterovirga rhinocerotis TaxID=1339210 RepID=A0A4R7CAS5_9HYPH|nr:pitrilysin family protein [Enterovirga rhinocerotis]TDR93907.1 putative Zn-dependent peptidase [Enterovirga rhinocerotis]